MSKKRRKSRRGKSPRRIRLLLQAILFAGGVAVVAWWWWQRQYPVLGIDVSHHQGSIHWSKVQADGKSFAFIKATEGGDNQDPDFSKNWANARHAGVLRGAYHFYRPRTDALLQAQNFLATVKIEPGDLPPVLDLEVTDGQSAATIQKGVRIWMKEVEKGTGVRPILYTLPVFANSYLGDALADYPLWVVDLGWGTARLPDAWDRWTFWQYSHRGKVDGIRGDVDLNRFQGSPDELKALCKK